jgi:hypothetical protein
VNYVTLSQSYVRVPGLIVSPLICEIFFTIKSSKMKKNEELEKDVQYPIKSEVLLNSSETGIIGRVGSHLKKIIYITSLAGVSLLLNSCVGGFVATEPAYVEYSRPARPSELYVWIDGDYAWNNQTHVYVQRAGYWEKPRQNQTFVSGHWQANAKGKSWAPGHWQRQGRQDNRRDR